ncbi:hypothetical protein TNCV_2568581 [Trichonephila clavipes]|uniref:Uncharacterized protein n=1 Tax=Trichonephila clavipes TaxID=2585209 RepID=A0A8X6WNF5_TRICX|nr:hypothetical protein TNCV_2568581 [Trichonephila clavipes]
MITYDVEEDEIEPHPDLVEKDGKQSWKGSLHLTPTRSRNHGSLMVKVSDRGCLITSSGPVPLKTRHVGVRCTLNMSRAQTSSRWCSVVAERGGARSGVVLVI